MFYDDARLMRMANIKDKKVYCCDCRHYRKSDLGYAIERICLHPNNRVYKDTFEKIEWDYEKLPRELNKNNDCKWFEKKSGIFSFFKNLCK